MNNETMVAPKLPCNLCLKDPKRTGWKYGEFMVTHCHHTNTGGVFTAQKNSWIIFSPVNEDQFAIAVASQLTQHIAAVELDRPN